MGLGDLIFENDCNSDIFLSESSIDDSNFQFFMNDSFFDIMQNISGSKDSKNAMNHN